MFQTWLDLNKQIIRKVIDGLVGFSTGYLTAAGGQWLLLIPLVAAIGNFIWFWIDNRNKVTVKGLEEAGRTSTALELEEIVEREKAKRRK